VHLRMLLCPPSTTAELWSFFTRCGQRPLQAITTQ
jgi:hypothetical protein